MSGIEPVWWVVGGAVLNCGETTREKAASNEPDMLRTKFPKCWQLQLLVQSSSRLHQKMVWNVALAAGFGRRRPFPH